MIVSIVNLTERQAEQILAIVKKEHERIVKHAESFSEKDKSQAAIAASNRASEMYVLLKCVQFNTKVQS